MEEEIDNLIKEAKMKYEIISKKYTNTDDFTIDHNYDKELKQLNLEFDRRLKEIKEKYVNLGLSNN